MIQYFDFRPLPPAPTPPSVGDAKPTAALGGADEPAAPVARTFLDALRAGYPGLEVGPRLTTLEGVRVEARAIHTRVADGGPRPVVLVDLTGYPAGAVLEAVGDPDRPPVSEPPADGTLALGVEFGRRVNTDPATNTGRFVAGRPDGEFAILVCDLPDPDRGEAEAATADRGAAVCIESPALLPRPVLDLFARLAAGDTAGIDNPTVYPVALRKLPPSPWFENSPLEKVVRPRYGRSPVSLDKDEYAAAAGYPNPSGNPIDDLVNPPPGPLTPYDLFRSANLLYLLRLCRRLATWGLEGKPVRCTLVLGHWPAGGQLVLQDKDDPTIVPCLAFASRPNLHLNSDVVRTHTELIQGNQIAALIDWDTLGIAGVVSHGHELDRYRGMGYTRLTRWARRVDSARRARRAESTRPGDGLTFAVRDARVEVYTEKRLALWHDGFEWRWEPFRVAEEWLRQFFLTGCDPTHGHNPDDAGDLTQRMVAAFSEMLDRRTSSLIAFVDEAGYAALGNRRPLRGEPDAEPLLVPMRAGVQSRLATPAAQVRGPMVTPADFYPVKKTPLPALRTLLQLDGFHLVAPQGGVNGLGYRFVDDQNAPADPNAGGSGRTAARALSRHLRQTGLVVDVSASGELLVFRDNVHLTAPPAAPV